MPCIIILLSPSRATCGRWNVCTSMFERWSVWLWCLSFYHVDGTWKNVYFSHGPLAADWIRWRVEKSAWLIATERPVCVVHFTCQWLRESTSNHKRPSSRWQLLICAIKIVPRERWTMEIRIKGLFSLFLLHIPGGHWPLHTLTVRWRTMLQHTRRILLPLPARKIRKALRTANGALS